MLKIADLARQLREKTLTSRELVEQCLGRINDPTGEGVRTYLSVYAERARLEADAIDRARQKNNQSLPPLAGIPISIKDLFDIAGEVTRAGSTVLDQQPPAKTDAAVVQRLRQAGFIILGKTNMVEFAFSGLGINQHFGTPLAPFERELGRIPGGSSSGGAVSVSDQMAVATIGSDTGGSCRIPAAFCQLVGFKPTMQRVPRDGMIPMSHSFDCVGPLAQSVSCCAVLDDVLSGGAGEDVEPYPLSGLRLGVFSGYLSEDVDEFVGSAFASALIRLSQKGVRLIKVSAGELDELEEIYLQGSIVGAEAYAWHQPFLATRRQFYDPWIRAQIEYCREQSAAVYQYLLEQRKQFNTRFAQKTSAFDALVLPTVAIIPPPLRALQDDDLCSEVNQWVLRNTVLANFLDCPSISIPCSASGEAPVGFMLMGQHGEDRRLLSIARGLEPVIRLSPSPRPSP